VTRERRPGIPAAFFMTVLHQRIAPKQARRDEYSISALGSRAIRIDTSEFERIDTHQLIRAKAQFASQRPW